MARPNEFPRATQEMALSRQRYRCASCGTRITALGNAGRETHAYGEGAQAHHMQPIRLGGLASLDNCVILCQACHYTAHEGGNYGSGTVVSTEKDYPYFRARERGMEE